MSLLLISARRDKDGNYRQLKERNARFVKT